MTTPSATPAAAATALLLARAQAGDEAARDRVFGAAMAPLGSYVRVRLGAALAQKVEPMDVVQDTFAAALPRLPEFVPAGPGAFVAWLCRIAERQIHDLVAHFAAGKRRPPVPATPWTAVATRLCASGAGPGSAAAQNDDRLRLEQALLGLALDEREVVLLHFFEERSLREIADATGRPTTSVHRLLGRAMARLGDALGTPSGPPTGAPP